MITFSFPDDEVLAALGRVTIAHGHHEYILKMTIKSLFDYSIDALIIKHYNYLISNNL